MNQTDLSEKERAQAEAFVYGFSNLSSKYSYFENSFDKIYHSIDAVRQNHRHSRKHFGRIILYFRALQLAMHESGHAVAFHILCTEDRQRVDGIYLSRDLGASSKVGGGVAARVDNTPGIDWPINEDEIWKDIYITHAGIFFDRFLSFIFSSELGKIELEGSNTRDAELIKTMADSLEITQVEAEEKADKELSDLNLTDRVMYLTSIIFERWQSGTLSTPRADFLRYMADYNS